MRMGIRYAYNVSLVLEQQNVIDLFSLPELDVLLLPDGEQILDVRSFQFRERHIVSRAVAHDSRNPGCRRVLEYPDSRTHG
jgi:hypothetical protein